MSEEPSTRPVEPSRTARAARPYAPVLDALRIAATVGVVAVHVLAPSMTQDSSPIQLAIRSLLATAVPIFVMISGALNLSPRSLREGSGTFLSRRLRRLLPAAIFWTLVYVVVFKVLVLPAPYAPTEMVRDLLTASSYAHLYFLPLIIGLTVISPLLATYIGESGRRAWICGALATTWSLLTMALPFLTLGTLGRPVSTVGLGTLTYFLPFIGYYLLGRAVWLAPPSRRHAVLLLTVAVPLLTGFTMWSYSADVTEQPPGQALLPTYLALPVVLLSAALMCGVIGLLRHWTVGEVAARWMRTLGEATFGVYLAHLVFLTSLQNLGVRGSTALSALTLILGIVVVSFALSLLGRKLPGLRRVL